MGPLKGLRIVDLARSASGRLLVTHLVDQGASAIRVSPEAGQRSEASVLERGRPWSNAEQQTWLKWVRGCDVVVDDGQLVAAGIDVNGLLEEHPALVVAVVDGPGGVPSEMAAGACSGIHAGPLGRRPHRAPWATVEMVASLLGATGVMSALLARKRDGHGQCVRVDLVRAALQVHELTALLTDAPPPQWRPLQWAASPFVSGYACRRGHFFVHLGLPHHLQKFLDQVVRVESPDVYERLTRQISERTRSDPSAVPTLAEASQIRTTLRAFFQQLDARKWESMFAVAGLCGVWIRRLAAWRDSSVAREAGHVIYIEDPHTGRVAQPGPAVVLPGTSAVDARTAGRVRWRSRSVKQGAPDVRAPLAGLRVLDLTQVIAGPVAARGLAELGADVLRIENPTLEVGWVPAFHRAFNAGKSSALVDLNHESLATLLAHHRPDVVVHNWRRSAARRLGLSDEAVQRVCPGAVLVELSAYGHHGPWADCPGWEQTAQAIAGVQLDAGRGAPQLHPQPIHDLCTGLAGTLGAVVALWSNATEVHASLARAATWLQFRALVRPDACYSPQELSAGTVDDKGAGFVRGKTGWRWQEPGLEVPWRTVRAALSEPSAPTFREQGDHRSSVRRIGPALELQRTALCSLAPASIRGADGEALASWGVEVLPAQSRDFRSGRFGRGFARLRWYAGLVRWGGHVAWTRRKAECAPLDD